MNELNKKMEGITQGSIIYPIRSNQYLNTRCYGIIITARCDIANNKVENVYMLVGLDVKEWLVSDKGINTVLKNQIESKRQKLESLINDNKLNLEVLERLSQSDAQFVISSSVKGNNKNDIINLFQEYIMIKNGLGAYRVNLIKENEKTVVKFLKDTSNGLQYHFLFIPQKKYLSNSNVQKGIMVDLQDIKFIPREDVSRIKSPGIDMKTINEFDKNEQDRQKKIYYLENDEDFVDLEGKIESPWCELLLQRFSHDFTRIGVDGPEEEDYKQIIKSMEE